MGVTDVVVAVDGGGTKTDVVAVGLDGGVVASRRGPRCSPQAVGLAPSIALVDDLVREVVGDACVVAAGLYVSGLDLPRELVDYRGAVARLDWGGLDWTARTDVDNDLFALLRAGTDEPDAVAVVCGTGVNAVGRRADGRTARFPALGMISGDWGGGSGLGLEALWHAARDVDGRGPRTALTEAVRSAMGVSSIPELISQLHFRERDFGELAGLAPVVFATSEAGDEVAQSLVDRQADEVVAFVRACVQRLDLSAAAVPVVLGGGVLGAGDRRLLERIASGVEAVAPGARIVMVTAPPIVGAALLALELAGAPATALEGVRKELG